MGAAWLAGNWQRPAIGYEWRGCCKRKEIQMLLRTIMLALTLALVSCATPRVPPAGPNFYVMRHLHTPAGATDPDLTAEGQHYAAAVSEWFRRDPPDVIYVSSP